MAHSIQDFYWVTACVVPDDAAVTENADPRGTCGLHGTPVYGRSQWEELKSNIMKIMVRETWNRLSYGMGSLAYSA